MLGFVFTGTTQLADNRHTVTLTSFGFRLIYPSEMKWYTNGCLASPRWNDGYMDFRFDWSKYISHAVEILLGVTQNTINFDDWTKALIFWLFLLHIHSVLKSLNQVHA